MTENEPKILVLGLGNILMKDEGVGVEVVQQLEQIPLPPFVDILDGGTGGFHLLGTFASYSHVIIVDAALGKDPPGIVNTLRPKYARDFPKVLSTHDIGLKDLIESASLLENRVELFLVTIRILDFQEMGIGLSPEVKNAIPEVISQISRLIKEIVPEKNQVNLK